MGNPAEAASSDATISINIRGLEQAKNVASKRILAKADRKAQTQKILDRLKKIMYIQKSTLVRSWELRESRKRRLK